MDKIIEMADDKSNENIETFFKVIKGINGKTPTKDELLELITPLIPEPVPGEKGEKGDKGDIPTTSELLELIAPLIPESIQGDKGEDYNLTDTDKQEIADMITVPVIEKIIEKTEVIKEVSKELSADELLNKIESLEETLSYDKLKGKPDIDDIYKNITKIHKQASKTVSVGDIDDYDFTTACVATGVTNVATITVDQMFFNRVGNVVHFAGAVTIVEIDQINPAVYTAFKITVPKYDTSTTFGNIFDLIGTGTTPYFFPNASMALTADIGATAGMQGAYLGNSFGGDTWVLHGSYKLL